MRRSLSLQHLLEHLAEDAVRHLVMETHYLDEADYPSGFDLNKFKAIPSFAGRLRYAGQFLQRLGAGSSRVAMAVDPTTVIKIARNPKGIAQNKTEIDVSNVGYGTAQVKDYDPDGLWIEMERATKFSVAKFKAAVGFSFSDFITALDYWYIMNVKGNKYYAPRPSPNQDAIENTELFTDISTMVGDFDMPVGDIQRPSSWGMVNRDGKEVPVLIDFGVTKEILNTYYKLSEQQQQSPQQSFAQTAPVARKRPVSGQQQQQQFNMEQFKTIKGLDQKMRYLSSTLPQVGEGSSRNVFKLDNNFVIKMAKSQAGIGQNKAEATVCSVDPGMELFAKVAEAGEGYEWLKSELALPMSEEEFKKIVGISWDTFTSALFAAFPEQLTQGQVPSGKSKQDLRSLAGSSWFKRVLNIMKGCQYKPGDISKLDSWGIVNGRAVIVDSGFTEAVHAAYYANQQ